MSSSKESLASLAIRAVVRMRHLGQTGNSQQLLELGQWFEEHIPAPLVEQLMLKLDLIECRTPTRMRVRDSAPSSGKGGVRAA